MKMESLPPPQDVWHNCFVARMFCSGYQQLHYAFNSLDKYCCLYAYVTPVALTDFGRETQSWYLARAFVLLHVVP